jgi:hypothetical protein
MLVSSQEKLSSHEESLNQADRLIRTEEKSCSAGFLRVWTSALKCSTAYTPVRSSANGICSRESGGQKNSLAVIWLGRDSCRADCQNKFPFRPECPPHEREHLLSPSLSSIRDGGEGGRRPGEEAFSVQGHCAKIFGEMRICGSTVSHYRSRRFGRRDEARSMR